MIRNTLQIRPLGKYGHIYEISGYVRYVYIAYMVVFYSLLASLIVAKYISTDICSGYFEWLCQLSPIAILVASLLGVVGQLKIASLGKNISLKDDSESTFEKSKIATYARTLYLFTVGTSSFAFAIWIALSIQSRLIAHKHIPTYGFFLLIIILYTSFYCFKRLILKKKQ